MVEDFTNNGFWDATWLFDMQKTRLGLQNRFLNGVCDGPRIFDQTTIAMADLTTAQTTTDSDCSLAAVVNASIVMLAPVRRLRAMSSS